MWDLTVPGNNDHDFYVAAALGTVPVLVHNSDCPATTPIYRVSPEGSGTDELENGFKPENFPRNDETGDPDGAAHFGNEARVKDYATMVAPTGRQGLRVDVPTPWLENPLIDQWPGVDDDQIEYVIPTELFGDLNEFPRNPWNPRG
jgi:hypothetical protein